MPDTTHRAPRPRSASHRVAALLDGAGHVAEALPVELLDLAALLVGFSLWAGSFFLSLDNALLIANAAALTAIFAATRISSGRSGRTTTRPRSWARATTAAASTAR